MVRVIGVRFKSAGKVYYFAPGDLKPEKGDAVIVETARGVELGEAVSTVKEVTDDEVVQPLREMIRLATPKDIEVVKKNRLKAADAFQICEKKIVQHELKMKLVDVEYAFDNSKIVFYFTADGRVDFRELVKDLASVFRTRIELRQIGVRDEAKMFGGMGPCGRTLCCSTFLGEFSPVSIKMAKKQNLTLNPAKISGMCGRLMCCLRYENATYVQMEKEAPRYGQTVNTPAGIGKVIGRNIIKETAQVELAEDQAHREFPFRDIEVRHCDRCK